MNISKERLLQIIKEECGAVMAMKPPMSGHSMPQDDNMTITGHPDHEIGMAYKQLNKTARYSQSLANKMQNMEEANLPAWVQSKITKASDYMSIVYHYLEEELDGDYDADMAITLDKQPVNEMMEMFTDPVTLTLGTAGLVALYYMLFGKKPDPEADLQRVRQEIEDLVTRSNLPSDPSADEKQSEIDLDDMRRKDILKRMKKERGIST